MMDPSPWLRAIGPALQALRELLPKKSGHRIIFIEQPLSSWESGRIVARTGLRMMPTFPRSPLTFRKASFPRYG
jgi:hypothetical protein